MSFIKPIICSLVLGTAVGCSYSNQRTAGILPEARRNGKEIKSPEHKPDLRDDSPSEPRVDKNELVPPPPPPEDDSVVPSRDFDIPSAPAPPISPR